MPNAAGARQAESLKSPAKEPCPPDRGGGPGDGHVTPRQELWRNPGDPQVIPPIRSADAFAELRVRRQQGRRALLLRAKLPGVPGFPRTLGRTLLTLTAERATVSAATNVGQRGSRTKHTQAVQHKPWTLGLWVNWGIVTVS